MKKYFQKTFAVSEQGAKDLVRASLWTATTHILLMAFNGLLYLFLKDFAVPILNGDTPVYNIVVYLGIGVLMFSAMLIAYYFQYNAAYTSAYKESANKRIGLAETLRKLPLSFFGKRDLSDVTTTIMTDTATLEQAFSHFAPELFGSIISISIISACLLSFNFTMGISILWAVPLSLFLCVITRKLQIRLTTKTRMVQLSYLDKIQECVENIKDIKSNNRGENHLEVMREKLDNHEKHTIIGESTVGILVTSAGMILKVGIATSMLTSVYLFLNGTIDVLMLLIFFTIATRIFEPIISVLSNIAAIYNSFVSIERMKDLENTKIQTGKESMNHDGYDINFKDVTFAYNNDETVLNGVSFTAKQGEVTALVGPSGGGKSTAIKLAARFWDIQHGTVTMGGEDINQVDPETLLKHISIVFQDVILFNNTVMENIRIGKIGATDEEVMESAKNAHCHDFIMKLPKGYETMIGENGSTLSGGERQRLSIARALLKDAPVVLLDEATSSLDIQNETAVQSAISRLTKNKTVIVIAHRMRTIAGADKIVLLKEGKVTQMGNHQELIKQRGDYANMVALQTESMNWQLS